MRAYRCSLLLYLALAISATATTPALAQTTNARIELNRMATATNGMLLGTGVSDERYDLWAFNADGSSEQLLFPTPGNRSVAVFSHDGNRIAFTRSAEFEPPKLFVASLTGIEERLIVTGGTRPAWSPDGQKIAYLQSQDDPFALARIRVIGADGTGDRPVITDAWGCADSGLWWNHATNRVMYFCELQGTLVSVAPDGSGRAEHGPVPGEFVYPAISPDGTQVAATRKANQNTTDVITWQIGSAAPPRAIVNLPDTSLSGLAWAPDQTRIAIGSYQQQVRIVDLNGGRVTLPAQYLFRLSWQPCTAGITVTCAALTLPYTPPISPPPPPGPGPVGPGPDDGAIAIGSRAAKQTKADRVTVRVTCHSRSATPCQVTARAQVAKARNGVKRHAKLGTGKATIQPGRTATITIKFTSSAHKALRKAKSLQTNVALTSTRADGSTRTATAKLTIKAKVK